METNVIKDGGEITVAVSGRLDENTVPELVRVFEGILDEAQSLILDFKELTYISASGLRLLLSVLQIMYYQGRSLSIRNASDPVRRIWNTARMNEYLEIE